MPRDLIRAEGATLNRGSRQILAPMNLALRTGQVTIAVGPNGAGKSTMLQLLTGSLRATSGQVYFDGRRMEHWRSRALARRRAVLSQAQTLAFPFTVREVVELSLETAGGRRDEPLVPSILARVGLEGFGGRLMQALSGGEQQRVHLARVLCQLLAGEGTAGQFLFLDEPTSSLDIQHQIRVLDLVRDLASPSLGVFMVLHDLNLAAAYADRLIVLNSGRIAADGPPRDVIAAPLLSRIYGVEIGVETNGERVLVLPRMRGGSSAGMPPPGNSGSSRR